jgi:pSer/pThr/pTyr-binding forkhead associated (FHA) protein
VIGADAAIWVTDLGSGNGTTLVSTAGEVTELEPNTPARVRAGSRLKIGDHEVTVIRHQLDHETTGAPTPRTTPTQGSGTTATGR